MKNFNDIVSYFGNQREMARILEVAEPAVSTWRYKGIPPARAIQIEIFTEGKFKAIEIVNKKFLIFEDESHSE